MKNVLLTLATTLTLTGCVSGPVPIIHSSGGGGHSSKLEVPVTPSGAPVLRPKETLVPVGKTDKGTEVKGVGGMGPYVGASAPVAPAPEPAPAPPTEGNSFGPVSN